MKTGAIGSFTRKSMHRTVNQSLDCDCKEVEAKGFFIRNPKAEPSDNGLTGDVLSDGYAVGPLLESLLATL